MGLVINQTISNITVLKSGDSAEMRRNLTAKSNMVVQRSKK